VDEALDAKRASRLLLTACPDDRQRKRAVRGLGWIACHMGDQDRVTLRAVSSWVPELWLTDDPGKLEHAAYKELASEFAADGNADEISDDQAVSNALSEPPISAAVILAGQSLQVSSGSCAACTPSAPNDEPPEPPSDDDG
jgi:hypothetical protein